MTVVLSSKSEYTLDKYGRPIYRKPDCTKCISMRNMNSGFKRCDNLKATVTVHPFRRNLFSKMREFEPRWVLSCDSFTQKG
jgi:hypothetical protein